LLSFFLDAPKPFSLPFPAHLPFLLPSSTRAFHSYDNKKSI
jgi:hypothetical protein